MWECDHFKATFSRKPQGRAFCFLTGERERWRWRCPGALSLFFSLCCFSSSSSSSLPANHGASFPILVLAPSRFCFIPPFSFLLLISVWHCSCNGADSLRIDCRDRIGMMGILVADVVCGLHLEFWGSVSWIIRRSSCWGLSWIDNFISQGWRWIFKWWVLNVLL